MDNGFGDWMLYSIFGLSPQSMLGEAVGFFVKDSLKIIMLLFVMIFVMGVVRTYISSRKINTFIAKRNGVAGYAIAGIFGILTPFCSCSSIPIFMGFLKAGVRSGIAFSFLVTSPLVNEYLVVLMLGFFGLEITAIYVFFGLLLGVTAGMIVTKFKLEDHIVEDFRKRKCEREEVYTSFSQRLVYGWSEAKCIVGRLWMWILVGVGIGAFIHGYIPEAIIHSILEKTGVLSVPIATLIGIPIYANCSAVVPIAVVLFRKGMPLGTALAFMMATAALSLPEAIILRRVLKLPLMAAFFGMVGAGIIFIGYLLNLMY